MEPAITIIAYLWDSRNTWVKHHEECACPFEQLAAEWLDHIHVEHYQDIVITDLGPVMSLKTCTAHEWSNLFGPEARKRALNEQATAHMNAASEILAMLATDERAENNG